MAEDRARVGALCREVRAQLPGLLDGSLPWWRRRLVELHLRRCEACREELRRQRHVEEALEELGADALAVDEPPAGLLDDLLDLPAQAGLRARAAVPARGAVSGARPMLSVLLLAAAAVAGTGAGYGALRLARALSRRGHGRLE